MPAQHYPRDHARSHRDQHWQPHPTPAVTGRALPIPQPTAQSRRTRLGRGLLGAGVHGGARAALPSPLLRVRALQAGLRGGAGGGSGAGMPCTARPTAAGRGQPRRPSPPAHATLHTGPDTGDARLGAVAPCRTPCAFSGPLGLAVPTSRAQGRRQAPLAAKRPSRAQATALGASGAEVPRGAGRGGSRGRTTVGARRARAARQGTAAWAVPARGAGGGGRRALARALGPRGAGLALHAAWPTEGARGAGLRTRDEAVLSSSQKGQGPHGAGRGGRAHEARGAGRTTLGTHMLPRLALDRLPRGGVAGQGAGAGAALGSPLHVAELAVGAGRWLGAPFAWARVA